MYYDEQLTAYARRQLKELYTFAALHAHKKESADVMRWASELLAFGSEIQINEFAKRLLRQSDPIKFLEETHGAFVETPQHPTFWLREKSKKATPAITQAERYPTRPRFKTSRRFF